MNALLQTTKVEIIERQAFNKHCIFDNHILAAIEAFDVEGSEKRRAQAFVTALTSLWKIYSKETYVPLFEDFIDMEIGLEALTQEHASHVNHVIQEFLFGYNVLMNCEYIKRTYEYEDGKNDSDSKFGELFFSWMAASLFHDIGYDIEKAPEEETFRENKNAFWDFMTDRATTQNPLSFSITGPGRRIIEEYILRDIKNIPGAPSFSYVEFENLFLRSVPNKKDWARYDHGVISAVKYIVELEKLQNFRGGNYLCWEPNRDAALAMALHNFRYKDCDLRLSCSNPRTLIPYVLIVSDEVQGWERERLDIDAVLPHQAKSGGKAKKSTDLIGITFREKRAFIILNHRLKDPSLKKKYEQYLDGRTLLLKKHYPIRALFPQLRKEIREKLIKSVVSLTAGVGASLVPIVGGILTSLIEIKPDTVNDLQVSVQRLKKLQEIANTECTKHLLVPTAPNPIYEICIDHRIDGDPYLTVVFPM